MTESLGTIVVLSGGLSHERDVSLRSGRRVAKALRDRGHTVVEADIDDKLIPFLLQTTDPVVFPVLYGGSGEDGSLRQVLQLIGVPFVGSSPSASRLVFDKSISIPFLGKCGIATPRQAALPGDMFAELGAGSLVQALVQRLGLPLMVKPARGGSAMGCTKVTRAEELPSAIVTALAYGQMVIVEEFIAGTEVAVSVIDRGGEPFALPAVEIRPLSGIYDYDARYTPGATRFVCPASLDESVTRACLDMALSAHRILGLTDFSRSDMIVTEDGTPVLLEISVAPGITGTSTFPIAVEVAGFNLGELCEEWLGIARGRYATSPAIRLQGESHGIPAH